MNRDDMKTALKELGWDEKLIDVYFAEDEIIVSNVMAHKFLSIEQSIIETNQPILRVNES